MRIRDKAITAIVLMLIAGPAAALDTDFYTYNGFSETVGAFRRLALILSDNSFLIFAGIFAIAGIVFGTLSQAYKGMLGEQINPVQTAIQVAIGLAVFKGLVMHTGTVHIYDPVRNAYEPVGGVPNIVVFVAGALNKFERAMISVVDTASANPYGDTAGAINFALIRAATSSEVKDWYLQQSLINYYRDCGLTHMGSSDGGGLRQRLEHQSTDLANEFSQWTSAARTTVYHPPDNDRGEVRTCTEAWSGTGGLASRVMDPSVFEEVTFSVCRQAGFNISDGNQLAKCKSLLQESTQLYDVSPGSELPFLRSVLLAGAVSRAMNSADVDRSTRALVNRQVMAEGIGNAEAMNQWIPKVRAFMLAVVLGVVPLTLLFLVTPLIKPAFMLNFGLFAWLALWGIGDGIAVQMAYDSAYDAFTEIRRQKLGVEAIMMSPEGSVQALGVFGKSRSTALAMASVLAFGLFKFGGYALTGLGQQWQNNIENIGDNAGRQNLLPEQNAQMQQQMMGVAGTMGQASKGFSQGSLASGMGQVRQTAAAGEYIDRSLELGRAPADMLTAEGRYQAADAMGDVTGTQGAAARAGMGGEDFRFQNAETRTGLGGIETNTQRRLGEEAYSGDWQRMGAVAGTDRVADSTAMDRAQRNQFGDEAPDRASLEGLGTIRNDQVLAKSEREADDVFRAADLGVGRNIEGARETLRLDPNAEKTLGQADARYGVAQGTVTNEVYGYAGLEGMKDAERLPRFQAVGAGQGAAELGGASLRGEQIGRANVAHQIAGAENLAAFTRVLKMSPERMADLVKVEQLSNGEKRLSVGEEGKHELIPIMQRAGLINDDQAFFALSRPGGAKIDVAYDPTAEAGQQGVFANVLSGGKAEHHDVRLDQKTNLTETLIGSRYTDVNTSDIERRDNISGDASLLEGGRLGVLLSRSFEGGDIVNGAPIQSRFDSLFSELGSVIGARGTGMSAGASNVNEVTGSANLNVGVNSPFGGFSVGGGGRRIEQSSGGVSASDAAYLHTRYGAAYRDELVSRYESQFPDGTAASPEGRRWIEQTWEQDLRGAIEEQRQRQMVIASENLPKAPSVAEDFWEGGRPVGNKWGER